MNDECKLAVEEAVPPKAAKVAVAMTFPMQVFHVLKVAAKESTRYAINGVYVKREGCECAVAVTDGRRLLRASWDEESPGVDFGVVVEGKQWAAAHKIAKACSQRDGPVCRLSKEPGDEGQVTITVESSDDCRTTISGAPAFGKFPKYEQVIPNYAVGKDADEIGFDPALLEETLQVARVAAAACEGRDGVRLIVPRNPKGAMVIASRGDQVKVLACVMPYNLASTPTGDYTGP